MDFRITIDVDLDLDDCWIEGTVARCIKEEIEWDAKSKIREILKDSEQFKQLRKKAFDLALDELRGGMK